MVMFLKFKNVFVFVCIVFFLAVKVDGLYSMNPTIFYIDTNKVAHLGEKSYDLARYSINRISILKKVFNRIYFYADDFGKNIRWFLYYNINDEKMYVSCNQVYAGDNCGADFAENRKDVIKDCPLNNGSFKVTSIETSISELQILNLSPVLDFNNDSRIYSPAYMSLIRENKGIEETMKDNIFSIKEGYNYLYPTIIDDRYILYIQGMSNIQFSFNTNIDMIRKIKIFDTKKKMDLPYVLDVKNAVKVYINFRTMELLILSQKYNDEFYKVFIYSIINNSMRYTGTYMGACWV
jgi:hypothetical protein